MCSNPKQASGFTLLELMVVIAIAGILMAMAVPSFNDMMRNNRLTTYSNELVTAINLARSEAVKRGVQVTIRRKSTTNSVWENGWDVFVDNVQQTGNVEGTLDGNDVLLKTYDALAAGYSIRSGANYSCWVAYTADGMSRGSKSTCTGGGLANDTFRVCDYTANTASARAIAINSIGRARTSKVTTACP